MHSPTDDFQRADALFDAALDLEPSERRAFVERSCGDDAALRAAVERLLRAHDRAGDFLGESAAEFAAPLVADADGGFAGAEPPPPQRVGPYRIVREIGRGGMGTVYLAERDDQQFRQRVALKLVRGALAADWMVQRFLTERRILASLEHAHIARLYDGGATPDGTPYFAMEYIEGEPIDRYCEIHALPLDGRLRLFRDVCTAVRYAHAHAVVHRDLKPPNILVTPEGDAKLLDFGIAKLLDHATADGDSVRTRTGMQLMTPEYAAPEQIRGGPVTAATDVYSLGIILFELVTGERPYSTAGLTPGEVERVVCETEPPRPSSATGWFGGRTVGGDLDTIVLKALQKEPERRYADAGALLDDLTRLAEGRPVLARPDSMAYRARKFIGRHRAGVLGAALVVATVPLLGVALSNARSRDRTGDPSLVAAGALRARDRMLVADFVDRAGDTTLAAAVTEAVRVDLTQSPFVRVLTPRQVRVTLTHMQRAPDVALDDSVAREVAAREGVKAIVTGSVSRTGRAYTVAVQLVDAERGDALAAFRETAADTSALIGAVDRVSRRLRNRIGESLHDLDARLPLEEVTTGSLAALRVYTQAQRLNLAGDRPAAIRLYERAVALDTGFAAAYNALAKAYDGIAETGRSKAALRHALANQQRLPFLERNFLLAIQALNAGDDKVAIDAYTRVLERYPDDVRALNNLALIYRDAHQYAAAESLFTRAAAVDSTIANLYFGIHTTQLLQGDFARSRRMLDLIATRFPGNPLVATVEVQDASAQQHWDAAEQRARQKIRLAAGDTLEQVDAYEALAGIVMTQGRLTEAERLWRTHTLVSTASGSNGRRLFGLVQRAYIDLRYRSDTARALALMDSSLRRFPLDSVLPGDRLYDELARFYAAAGRVARARELSAAADANDRALDRIQRADRRWTRGVIALADGSALQAEGDLSAAAQMHVCPICVLPALARAQDAVGHHDAAITTYERYLSTSWLFRYESDAVELGSAIRRLAELRVAKGDAAGAAQMQARLRSLWRHADPELQQRFARDVASR